MIPNGDCRFRIGWLQRIICCCFHDPVVSGNVDFKECCVVGAATRLCRQADQRFHEISKCVHKIHKHAYFDMHTWSGCLLRMMHTRTTIPSIHEHSRQRPESKQWWARTHTHAHTHARTHTCTHTLSYIQNMLAQHTSVQLLIMIIEYYQHILICKHLFHIVFSWESMHFRLLCMQSWSGL